MISLLQITRPRNILIAIFSLCVGVFISHADFSWQLLLANASAFALAIAFGNIFNDILDLKADRINRPNRPLPAGKISLFTAKISAALCLIFTLACAGIPQSEPLLHLAFFAVLLLILFFYDRNLKHIPLLKNLTVAFLCTTPLLRILFLTNANPFPLYTAAAFAFFLTLSREILKDLQDQDGDLIAGIATFPLIAGEEKAKNLALLLLVFTIFLIPLPVALNWLARSFLLTLCVLIPLAIYIIKAAQKKNYHSAQKWTKLTMLAGLIFLIFNA